MDLERGIKTSDILQPHIQKDLSDQKTHIIVNGVFNAGQSSMLNFLTGWEPQSIHCRSLRAVLPHPAPPSRQGGKDHPGLVSQLLENP